MFLLELGFRVYGLGGVFGAQAVKHATEKAQASRAASEAQGTADKASRKQQSRNQKSGKASTRKAALAAAAAKQRAKKQVPNIPKSSNHPGISENVLRIAVTFASVSCFMGWCRA